MRRRRFSFIAAAALVPAAAALAALLPGSGSVASTHLSAPPVPPTSPAVPPAADSTRAAPAREARADEIIDRFEQSIGGRERWLRDHSRTFVYSIELTTRAESALVREAQGTMIIRRKAPDRMISRMEVTDLGRFIQGYDGTRGWSARDDGPPRLLEGAELAERRRESIIDRDIRLRELYPVMTVQGETAMDGRACWSLRLESTDGRIAQAWFDRENGRMVAFGRLLDAGGTQLPVVQHFSDWREHDGQWFPYRIEQVIGATTQVMTLQSIDHECIEDSEFECPVAAAEATPAAAPPSTQPSPPTTQQPSPPTPQSPQSPQSPPSATK